MEVFFSLCDMYPNIAIQCKDVLLSLNPTVSVPQRASFYVQVHLHVCIQPPCSLPIGVHDPLGELGNAGTCTLASVIALPARAILICKVLDSDSKASVPVCKYYATSAGMR